MIVPNAVTDLAGIISADPILQLPRKEVELKTLVREALLSSNPAPLAPVFSFLEPLQTSIAFFQEKYTPHRAAISEKSWTHLKRALGDKMQEPYFGTSTSLEQFRDLANTFINETTETIGAALELHPVTWSSCGTVGYRSDVDITINSSSFEDTVFYKILRDLVHKEIFGGSSGEQLDTQCYIPHPAEFDLEQYLLNAIPHMQFLTGEKAAICFQAYMSLGMDPETYAEYKRRDLESIDDESERKITETLFDEVESVITIIQKRGQIPLLLKLAQRYSRLQNKISREMDRKELNLLHLEQQRCLMLIAAMQKEGTVSVAEGKATILKDGGQKSAQEKKQRTNSFSEFRNCNPETIREIQSDPNFKRKFSAPLTSHLDQANSASRELVLRIYGSDVEKFLRPKYEKPDGLTCLLAAYEESWQLIHIVHEGFKESSDPTEVAVGMGKYAHRIAKNMLRALDELKAPSGYLRKAILLEQKCKSLEICKRASRINSHAAKLLLHTEILDSHRGRGSLNADDLSATLEGVFKIFEFKGTHHETLLDEKTHLKILKRSLRDIKSLWVDPKHTNIYPILRGHAGFKVEKNLIEDAKAVTLTHFDLTSKEKVMDFLHDILKFSQEMRNWARKEGYFPHSSPQMASFYDFKDLVRMVEEE